MADPKDEERRVPLLGADSLPVLVSKFLRFIMVDIMSQA